MKALFLDDAYLTEAQALVAAVREDGAIELTQTCFYATSGGQPGDTGVFIREDGSLIRIAGTVTGEHKGIILHVPEPGQPAPDLGDRLTIRIDRERRLNHMRMHTACHLLSVVCPYPITGASVNESDSRIDIDMAETISKEEVTAMLMALIEADHPVYTTWISEDDLEANPGLVKSKNVRPPRGQGRIRLVCIGENASVDSQPCGGTHVRSTGEIGPIHVGKIEKKGKENRRFRLRFGPLPA